MRDFCKVSPTIWRSQKFNQLSSADQLLYFYFLTCTHGNSIGCYYLPLAYAAVDLKLDEDTLKKGIKRVSSVGLISYDEIEQIVLIHNWLTFNEPMNPKHGQKIVSDIAKIPSATFQQEVAQSFNAVSQARGWSVLAPTKNAGKGIERVSTQRLDKTETKTETETPEWIPANEWLEFLGMRKAIKKPATEKAKALLIADLQKLRTEGHDPKAVLEQSIKNNWQGLFGIKTGFNSGTKTSTQPVGKTYIGQPLEG